MKTLLKVKNLSKQFDSDLVLKKINFEINNNEIVGLIGPNGAGKTTTIKCILNLLTPTSGTIYIYDKTIFDDEIFFKRAVAYIPEQPIYYSELTPEEHLKFIAMAFNIDKNDFLVKKNLFIEKFNISKYLNKKFFTLSKGTQQKFLLLMALVRESNLLIIDEPFRGLDPIAIDEFIKLIVELKNHGHGILLCTHDLSIADKLCDKVLLLNEGEQLLFGDLEKLKLNHSVNTLKDIFFEKVSITENTNDYLKK
ncbi:MAG: ABC transporter ATP-binding protein [Halanaerobiales bacterium]|nr:ABC transporter ATP-binding protein [Halanaerobiales bacterium]